MREMHERISELFDEKNLKGKDIAAQLKKTPAMVSMLRSGATRPSAATIEDIAALCETTPEWIISETGPKHPPKTLEEEMTERFGRALRDPDGSARKRLLSVLLALPPERWEELADLLETLAAGLR